MGLDVPDLDDREFEEVFEEARKQIPVYSEEWSDHNAHDTGIAILELLAWISETYTYQLDRVTDEHREKYLELLGVERRSPRPASTRISIDPPAGADGVELPAGEPLVVDDRSGVEKTFETVDDVTLTEASVEKVVTRVGDDSVDNTTENETDDVHFLAFGGRPAPGDALYLGFDRDPFAAAEALELTVDFYEEDVPAPAEHGDLAPTFEPAVELAWEHCTDYADWDDDAAWSELSVRADETDAFYRGGAITLEKPPDWDPDAQPIDDVAVLGQPSGLVWLRCRLATAGYEVPPQFNSVRLNVAAVSHRATVTDETLQRADDGVRTTIDAGQEFFFERSPVLDAEIAIDGERWTEVDDFDTSGPTDRHYVLDSARGAVRFGDGRNGAKPPVGRTVVAERYVHGGGREGNVSETSEWEFAREDAELADGIPLADVDAEPIAPATGGTDAESIEDAMNRFKRDLKTPYRAVTLDDYRYVATHTPGLRFGRAEATIDETHTVDGEASTAVRVVVVPYSPHPRPEPSDAFVDAVRRHLDRARLVTDRVTVEAPTYVDVDVDLAASITPGQSEQRLTRTIREELLEYFHPLRGFDGDGWPFGRPLYVSELEDVVEGITGVDRVLDVTIRASGEQEIDDHGNVLIDEMALLSLSERDVSVSLTASADVREGRR